MSEFLYLTITGISMVLSLYQTARFCWNSCTLSNSWLFLFTL